MAIVIEGVDIFLKLLKILFLEESMIRACNTIFFKYGF